jgi:dUTP pyrophosphatase
MSNGNLCHSLLEIYGKYMHLKIFIDSSDNQLLDKYIGAVNDHHLKMCNNIYHIDAGFDLFSPENYEFLSSNVNKLDYQLICSAQIIKRDRTFNTGFYMYPRSSISKSKLRLANNVGIIDAGYRGHLMGMFDILYTDTFDVLNADKVNVNKFDRYAQICAPGLIPIIIEIVNSREDLGEKTTRGDGGFGSTGK